MKAPSPPPKSPAPTPPLPTSPAPPVASRFLAPDLARGLMLALIAMANVMLYLHARPTGPRQHVLTESVWDHAVSGVMTALVEARAHPLFAALFGYGLVQMARRRSERGLPEDAVRRSIRRRSAALIAFGAVHALLAFNISRATADAAAMPARG